MPLAAGEDACAPLRSRHGEHALAIVGGLALESRARRPSDADLACLEQIWSRGDGGMREEATRTLLAIAASHAAVVLEAARARPGPYARWMAEWEAQGIADYTGQGRIARMVRKAERDLRGIAPRSPAESAAQRLLLDALRAVKVYRVE